MHIARIDFWLSLLLICGCGTEIAQTTAEPRKVRARDAGRTDAGRADAGSADAGRVDAGRTGVGRADAGASCGTLESRVRVTSFDAPSAVMANDEWHPVVIAPRRAGGVSGSFVAWRAAADNTVLLAKLDERDHLVDRSFLSFAGSEVHSVLAPDDVGGAIVLVADDSDIYSNSYCISTAKPNNPGHCQKLDLLRFDDAGGTTWRTTLTDKTPVDSNGAIFIWSGFEHTARVVWNGTWYGVYFRSAGSFARGGSTSAIDMFPGDTLRFVDQSGTLSNSGGWDFGSSGGSVGCVNSWSVRLAFDGRFLAACHGNPTPNAMRLAIVEPMTSGALNTSELLSSSDPYRRALGGLVPSAGGFWLNYISSDNNTLRLHLTWISNAASGSRERAIDGAKNLGTSYPFRPYMAAYGAGQLLLGYKTQDGALQLALADAATGALIEGPVPAGASIDQFQDFVSDPNGDVIWAYNPGNAAQIQIVRVTACR
jgi:hypothetical protein